jgi:predicted RNA polymerase sigma factor
VTEVDVRRAIEAIYRLDEPKLVARMARLTGDLSAAEELAHDAFLAAIEQWPAPISPDSPRPRSSS